MKTVKIRDRYNQVPHLALEILKVTEAMRKAKNSNQYNQVPRQTQDTVWESDNIQENITTKETRGQPFPNR